jgi:flagellar biosynthesis/type III secretory pathway protein FliH
MTKLVAFEVAEEYGVEKGIKKGIEIGIGMGREQGLQQGAEQEKISIVLNMLQENVPVAQINQYTKLPSDFIDLLKEKSADITLDEALSIYRQDFRSKS